MGVISGGMNIRDNSQSLYIQGTVVPCDMQLNYIVIITNYSSQAPGFSISIERTDLLAKILDTLVGYPYT